ncbi:MAG: signal peptidase I [Candidatus Bathyarchaeia archaeon]|jgi:signal peptidase
MNVNSVSQVVPLVCLVVTYLFLSLAVLVGVYAYIVPSICWLILAFVILKIIGLNNIKANLNKNLVLLAGLTAATQITVLIFISIFTSFGRSPYTGSSILNILYFVAVLLGTELARAQIITAFPKQKKIIGIAVVTLIFTVIAFTPARYMSLGEPVETVKFLGQNFLPAIAMSLLATYLALLGGPVASITYVGVLQGFEWLSPILPNPDWTLQALVGTLVPALGFIIINETVKPSLLIRHGLTSEKEVKKKRFKKENFPYSWIAISIVALVLLWSNSGLFGFQPSIVASGSMQPALQVGDMAIVVHTKPDSIHVGDVIQYHGASEPIIHRVIDKYTDKGTIYFITKGDANNAQDPLPVSQQQVVGKSAFVIPKLGWASICLRNAAATVYDAVLSLPQTLSAVFGWLFSAGVYITASLSLIALIIALITNTKLGRKQV